LETFVNICKSYIFKILGVLLLALQLVSCAEKSGPVIDEDKKINLAHTFLNNELFEAAIQEYEEYLAEYSISNTKRANIYYQIANIYFERLNDYNKALENYLRIKYLFPESELQSEIGKRIVNCLERLERSQDAQRILEKETALKPDQVAESKPGEVLAIVGDKKITQGDLDFEIGQMPTYLKSQFSTREQKLAFLRQYIAESLLYDSAKRKNLDQDKDVIEGTFRTKKQLMAQKILQEEIQKMVDIQQTDIELYYKANKEKYVEKNEEGKVTRQKSFQESTQEVAQDLILERQQEAYQKLIERLMKAEKVTIYESRLK
jgi:tetratricopeptide (TPR) repeat protein